MASIGEALARLAQSKFRASFGLTVAEREYVTARGMEVIRSHTADFVRQKLAPAHPINDGKQTPMRGHPVFKAMHATACCCRGCLQKWYQVPEGRELSGVQQEKIVNLLLAWIEAEMEKHRDV